SLLAPEFHEGERLIPVLRAHEGSDPRVALEGISDLQLAGGCDQRLDELPVDGLMDEHALRRRSRLPLVRESGAQDSLDRSLEIGVHQDDRAGLALRLE